MIPGVFLGWKLAPGGKWTKRYLCTPLKDFVGMDLRVGGHISVQEAFEVNFDIDDFRFPLKACYDKAC